jgi:hypothetical protein
MCTSLCICDSCQHVLYSRLAARQSVLSLHDAASRHLAASLPHSYSAAHANCPCSLHVRYHIRINCALFTLNAYGMPHPEVPITPAPFCKTAGLRHLTNNKDKCSGLPQDACGKVTAGGGCCWTTLANGTAICATCRTNSRTRVGVTCDASGCKYTCAAGWGDCNNNIDGDGCEVSCCNALNLL